MSGSKGLPQINRETFDQQRRPRFGTANPERMQLEFWEWMIRGEDIPQENEEGLLGKLGLMVRNGVVKSGYGPYRARDLFKVEFNADDGPIWTFDRMGSTQTNLPDGRVICIAGEHEDSYDPDFHIYNDVVVFGPENQIEIYGYPKEVFPPTDFHSASLVDNQIIIIGCVGYQDERRPGHTPVYSLDLNDYHISEVKTTGEAPGWIFKHEAETLPDGTIVIRNGEIIEDHDGKRRNRRNIEEFSLDHRTGVWKRITNRNWLHYSISQEKPGLFLLEKRPSLELLYPKEIDFIVELEDAWNRIQFLTKGVTVSVVAELQKIEIIFEGELSIALADKIADEIRANTEAAIQCPCVLQRL